jgi:glycolate oxidase FAD binding subunit
VSVDLGVLAGRLGDVLGSDALETAPREIPGVTASLCAAPATAEQVAACLAIAQSAGASVAPLGGGSQQRIGYPAGPVELLLDVRRLDACVAWEPGDLTASFQAGVTLASAQRQLAEAGQQLAIDAPRPDQATLGGLVATNTWGPRRWRHGRWRDQIIGMEMALPSGELIKSGGRVVKNVQGYDLAKLFIGSLGTLGVITQLNVRVIPLPELQRLFFAWGERDPVLGLLRSVAASTLRVSALDLLDAGCASLCGLPPEGWVGLILQEGSKTQVEAGTSDLVSLAAAQGLHADSREGQTMTATMAGWLDLGRVDDLNSTDALVCLSCQPAEISNALDAIEATARQTPIGVRCWAHAGNGTVFARLSAPSADETPLLSQFQGRLLPRWPWTTLTAGDPDLALAAHPWGQAPPGLELMRALKRRFDPRGSLQPGRYVGGI